MMRHDYPHADRDGREQPNGPMPCDCPTHPSGNGDIRCHVCGEYVNVRCWNCRTFRGDGPCPNAPTPDTKEAP